MFILKSFVYINVLLHVSNCISFRAEARVYCQDTNAKPWVPLGHTCPVGCGSILSAIDKLKMLDYKKSIKEQLGGRNKPNKNIGHLDDIYYPNFRRNLLESDGNSTGNTDLTANNDINEITNVDTVHKTPKNNNDLIKSNNFIVNANIKKFKQNKNKFNNRHKNKAIQDINVIETDENIKTTKEIAENVNANTKIIKETQYNENNKHELNKETDHNKLNLNDLEILQNIKNVKGILRRSGIPDNITKYSNNIYKERDRCWFLEKFKTKLMLGKVVRRRCKMKRRSNFDAKFVTVMTNVLNKYVDTKFRFTDEMTEILLENIFGGNTDLRNNIFDVNKLLIYLRKSVDRHKTHSYRHVITLKSRHCLTVSLPGCFCRPGYVESSGQCVKPEDCVNDISHLHYLSRIVIL